jgi:Polyketide cyclase / dehydrase and lipid transport
VAKSYYSTVFEQSADAVWQVIRDFNNYPVWVEGAGTSEIEGGKSGDAVGCVRSVLYDGRHIRQRLKALSDTERAQTYAFAEEGALPVTGYEATLRVTPIVDGDRAFVEWWATFDCAPAERDARVTFFRDAFAGWLQSLRGALVTAGV